MSRAKEFLERRRGRPLVADRDCERCQALTGMTRWKTENKKEQRCPFMSKYLVEDKELCRHHAVMDAMALALERGVVKRIPRSQPRVDQRVQIIKDKP